MIAEGGPAVIELYQPSQWPLQTLLDNLCVADRFPIVEHVDWPTDQFQPVPLSPQPQQKSDLIRASIEAHQTLMSVNDATAMLYIFTLSAPVQRIAPAKQDLAREVMKLTNNEGAGIVIEATGVTKVMESTEDLVAAGGTIVIAGLTTDKVTFTGMSLPSAK